MHYGNADDDNRDKGGNHTQRQTADNDGGGAGYRGASQLLGGLVGIRSVVLGEVTDQDASNQTG